MAVFVWLKFRVYQWLPTCSRFSELCRYLSSATDALTQDSPAQANGEAKPAPKAAKQRPGSAASTARSSARRPAAKGSAKAKSAGEEDDGSDEELTESGAPRTAYVKCRTTGGAEPMELLSWADCCTSMHTVLNDEPTHAVTSGPVVAAALQQRQQYRWVDGWDEAGM